ncbi:exopolysaccharide biosynthesis protein, partial [Wolbachia endosymbiont of Drosophila santomea]
MSKNDKLTKSDKLASDILKEVADTNNNDSDKVTLFDIKTALH